jgi:hypothetical protein
MYVDYLEPAEAWKRLETETEAVRKVVERVGIGK